MDLSMTIKMLVFCLLLYQKFRYSTPTAYNSKNEYFAINFQSIEELSSKNNNVADIDKFLSEYKKNIGKFCFYIPDQILLNQLVIKN